MNAQSKWLGDMMVMHLSTPDDYRKRDQWRADLATRFAAQLPVESKKQLLGTLEMAADATLVFRFTFYWNNAIDGGKLALEIPRAHPGYAETLAFAPGLAAGQARVIYRDRDGVVSDKP
jgi:hypothetical protein